MTELQIQDIKRLFNEGYGRDTISRMTKVTIKRLERFMNENGLRRTRKEAMKALGERVRK